MWRIPYIAFCALIFSVLPVCTVDYAFGFKLPDTGQTKCYQNVSPWAEVPCAGTGQDGAYNINPMSFTDNGNGTVTDNNTGLMWQQLDDGNTYNWYVASGTHDETENPSRQDFCDSLSLGNYDDWRLPTKKELMTIVNYGMSDPAIDATHFPDTKRSGRIYWSSTAVADYPDFAWGVYFYDGTVAYENDKLWDSYVRCVRGGPLHFGNLRNNGDGTVTDRSTGLMWQQGESSQMSWPSALSYCEALFLGNHMDWRLPNLREIESITDDARYNPAIDTAFFPNAVWSYWSSTSRYGSPEGAWVGDFDHGSSYDWYKGYDDTYVRCVRSGQSSATKIGVCRVGSWALDYNGSQSWNPGIDKLCTFGLAIDIPVSGDWDGDGFTQIGVFRVGTWILDQNGNGAWDPSIDRVFNFGLATDKPVVGDWAGAGWETVGVFRYGTWALDYNGNGRWDGCGATADKDRCHAFGLATDIPVTGDWNGDGRTEIGVFRSGSWYLDYNGNGRWDGCGATADKDRCHAFGLATDIPVTGDWNANGNTEIGVFRRGTWVLDYNGNGVWNGSTVEDVFTFGMAEDKPVTGSW